MDILETKPYMMYGIWEYGMQAMICTSISQ